jgi:hypothetical protein
LDRHSCLTFQNCLSQAKLAKAAMDTAAAASQPKTDWNWISALSSLLMILSFMMIS